MPAKNTKAQADAQAEPSEIHVSIWFLRTYLANWASPFEVVRPYS